VPVTDPKANVKVTTRKEAGSVRAKMLIDLTSYTGEAITVSLGDGDTSTIASQGLGPLGAVGTSGRKWRFKTNADGVQRIVLRSLAPHRPGQFRLSLKAKRWFTAAAANQSAANTLLTVQIGQRCFTHRATSKVD
jgi:hypothetical protein